MENSFEQIIVTLNNLQIMIGKLYNKKINAARSQISKDVIKDFEQQFEEMKITRAKKIVT